MTAANPPTALPSAHKIRPRHLDRLAVVYIRQSSPHQVACNRESTDLQYQLRRRAVALGWADDRVLIIDDDQGISGQSVENRPGFQRLLAEVSLGHVGIVFGREVSRLARSCKDWHQLLELCGLFQVLISDADGVYDPTDANDRMLLGLRGMMSEAELHVLRTRLHQGKLNKARRGELFTCVPIGYVRSADGGIALDPDEEVRSVVGLVFAKYAELGSVSRTHAFLVANGIRLGLRVYKGAGKGQLEWRRPRRGALYEMLCHPFYAGAYAYGRCPLDPTGRATGKSGRRRHAPPEEWLCLLQDKVPAYISWAQYEANRRRLASHDAGRGRKAATGRRRRCSTASCCPAATAGGRCWRHNSRPTANPRYACAQEFKEYGGPRCQSVTAAYVDRLIEALVLRAVEPAALELSFRAAEQAEQDRDRLHAALAAAAGAGGLRDRSGKAAVRCGRPGEPPGSPRWSGSGKRSSRAPSVWRRTTPASSPSSRAAWRRPTGSAFRAGHRLAGPMAGPDHDGGGPAHRGATADRAGRVDAARHDGAGRGRRPLARRHGHPARDRARAARLPRPRSV